MLEKHLISDVLYKNYLFYYEKIDEIQIDFDNSKPFLNCEDVLDCHYLICDHFLKLGEGIAGFGPKDFGLLASAVGRQLTTVGGVFVYESIWDTAASLMFGLINNHPFHDGNKRTAFLSVVFFLIENGYTPNVDIVEVEDFTVFIAEYRMKNGSNISIDDISSKLRRMFRSIDAQMYYVVTFNELNNLLRRHGCSIGNPSGNFINVYKGDARVSQIGFPGWTREVTRNAISTVRKSTGLTKDNGIDSEVFFRGADPLSKLIGQYEEPLRRLAYR